MRSRRSCVIPPVDQPELCRFRAKCAAITLSARLSAILPCCLILILLVVSNHSSAQTIAYRTASLAASHPGANHLSQSLLNPWGMAFLPGGNFFIAENASGRVDSYDADGNLVAGVSIPPPPGSAAAFSKPTGIVAVPQNDFGPGGFGFEFLVAADNGTVWGFPASNGVPATATPFVDHSSGAARYTGIAVLRPACCGAFVAVANFGQGTIDLFTRLGDPLSLAPLVQNAFVDPNLPTGYAPFNIQIVGDLVVVTYALKGGAGNPLNLTGAGIVSLFNQQGNFVERFISDGDDAITAPWGVALAPADFGPLSNALLIANAAGEGTITGYDPSTRNFLGQLSDGAGNPLFFVGLRGIAFRDDGVGNANALYDVSGAAAGAAPVGTFGTLTTGNAGFLALVNENIAGRGINLADDPIRVSATVISRSGIPTGTIAFTDFCCAPNPITQTDLGTIDLANGVASITTTFTSGEHQIFARYSGDANFVPSTSKGLIMDVAFQTTTDLAVPSTTPAGVPLLLHANVRTIAALPFTLINGQVTFSDGDVNLGTATVTAGAAQLTVGPLSEGAHSISAAFLDAMLGTNFLLGSKSGSATVSVIAGPAAVLSTTNIAFGEEIVSASSPTEFLKISNTGNGVLNISPPQLTGDFVLSSNNCVTPITAGADCSLGVVFAPTAVGVRTGSLTITDNSPASPHVVMLGGTGTDPSIIPIRPGRPAIVSLSPGIVRQNAAGFILVVRGSNFAHGAVISWNGSTRTTTFVSDSELQASISSTDLWEAGTAAVTVVNSGNVGDVSSPQIFAIDTATATSLRLGTSAVTVAAGESTNITTQPNGFTGSAQVTCVNAPAGVSCAFNPANNALTIRTVATTAPGDHLITVVFSSQALARHASSPMILAAFAWSLGLPLGIFNQTRRPTRIKTAFWMVVAIAVILLGVGCGGSQAPKSSPTSPGQPVQASAELTLTVQ